MKTEFSARMKEVALIKGLDKYKLSVYNGPTMNLTSKHGIKMMLRKGDKFGARKSASGKQLRFVFEALGLTRVFSLDTALVAKIYKASKPTSLW